MILGLGKRYPSVEDEGIIWNVMIKQIKQIFAGILMGFGKRNMGNEISKGDCQKVKWKSVRKLSQGSDFIIKLFFICDILKGKNALQINWYDVRGYNKAKSGKGGGESENQSIIIITFLTFSILTTSLKDI